MRERIKNEKGQFVRQLKPWSLDAFNEGFISKRKKGDRFMVYLPNHPRTSKNGHVHRHIAVYEAIHGVEVKPPYLVHHIDGNTLNDNPENLLLMTNSEHKREHMHRRGKGLMVTRICKNCGKPFEILEWRLKSKNENRGTFCSLDCYYKYNVSVNHYKYIRTITLCENCGKPFEHKPSDIRRFCSHACSALYRWKKGV